MPPEQSAPRTGGREREISGGSSEWGNTSSDCRSNCTSSSNTFDQRVWRMVSLIPEGRLATYGQIAELIGAYGQARQVGWALRRLHLSSTVPWQRVVNAKGEISMSLSREGSDWLQRQLLRAEGIPVDGEGRLPLQRFRWAGPADGRP